MSLRSDHPALSPAQLNHLLSLYSPASPRRRTWTPSVHEQAAACETGEIIFMILSWAWHSLMVVCTINGNGSWDWGLFFVLFITIYFLPPSANILESFETHQPLVLPDGGYQFQLGREVLDSSLLAELDNIKKFVSGSQLKEAAATEKQKVWNSVNTLVCINGYSGTCLLGIQLLQNGHLCQSL